MADDDIRAAFALAAERHGLGWAMDPHAYEEFRLGWLAGERALSANRLHVDAQNADIQGDDDG